nr:MAG TPA: hypothetical protein [Caudoviricetes sp.]
MCCVEGLKRRSRLEMCVVNVAMIVLLHHSSVNRVKSL